MLHLFHDIRRSTPFRGFRRAASGKSKKTRVPKRGGAKVTNQAETTKKSDQYSQTQVPAVPAHISAVPTDSSESHSNSDVDVQRKIEVFTGLLVVVGFLQVGVMILQWLMYRHQAKIMRHQAHEMKRQRVTMHGQLGAMQGQLSEMGAQTKVLKDSVAHAGTSADSALRSVKLQEAQLRQWLDIQDLDVGCPHIPPSIVETVLVITFQIVNPTKMVLTLTNITITLFESDTIVRPVLEYTLAPDNGYPMSIEVPISGESFRQYTKNVFVIPMAGLIEFRDAFQRVEHFGFGFNCRCRQGWFDFSVYEQGIPKKPDAEKEGDNPN